VSTTAHPTPAQGGTAGTTVPLLSVDGLSVQLFSGAGWVSVIDDVSFAVRTGETLGIVGESGSGKSVTSLAIMGLLEHGRSRTTARRLELGGRPLLGIGRRELEDLRGRHMAMIFQEPMTSLNPAFTIGDQIAETVRRHRGVTRRAAMARAVEVLDLVGIPDARRRITSYPHELSGGMRQRVMIAMAASCEPSLLIADEPTTALDVTIQAQILDLLKTMNRELGMAIVLITHDLGVVAEVCDRVLVMYAGQVQEQGSATELFHRPHHPYTHALLRSMPDIEAEPGELPFIPGQAPAAGRAPAGCRFHDRCAHAVGACSEQSPAIVEITSGRLVRCLRHDELTLTSTKGAS
jgi:peptide/nickel transport system ATP-binding protein